jgi:hypothetical protein
VVGWERPFLQSGEQVEVNGRVHRLKRQRPGQIKHRPWGGVQGEKGSSFQKIGLNGFVGAENYVLPELEYKAVSPIPIHRGLNKSVTYGQNHYANPLASK